ALDREDVEGSETHGAVLCWNIRDDRGLVTCPTRKATVADREHELGCLVVGGGSCGDQAHPGPISRCDQTGHLEASLVDAWCVRRSGLTEPSLRILTERSAQCRKSEVVPVNGLEPADCKIPTRVIGRRIDRRIDRVKGIDR